MPMRVTDAAHLGLMLTALGLAYLVPFELLLLAYVVLGPAHYATEISWLHDRKYFLPQRGVAIALGGNRNCCCADRERIMVRLRDVERVPALRADGGHNDADAGGPVRRRRDGTHRGARDAWRLAGHCRRAAADADPRLAIHVGVHDARRLAVGCASAVGARRALCCGDNSDLGCAAVCRDLDPVVRKSRRGIFRERGAGARTAVGRSEPTARYPAHQPARFRLHLSLPQLVHQSRDHPLE